MSQTTPIPSPPETAAVKPAKAPDTETLAVLAAIVGLWTRKNPRGAVAYAWELWCEAEALLSHGALDPLWERGTVRDETFDITGPEWKGRLPKRFPASLDDFLRLIVKAKTLADSMKRLRDYFRDQGIGSKEPDYAEKAIQMYREREKRGGGLSQRVWCHEAREYDEWWAKQRSIKAEASARSPRKKARKNA